MWNSFSLPLLLSLTKTLPLLNTFFLFENDVKERTVQFLQRMRHIRDEVFKNAKTHISFDFLRGNSTVTFFFREV